MKIFCSNCRHFKNKKSETLCEEYQTTTEKKHICEFFQETVSEEVEVEVDRDFVDFVNSHKNFRQNLNSGIFSPRK